MTIVRRARSCCPQLAIIVMTPYGIDEYAAPAIEAGATDFLSRPTSVERIRLTIRNVLKVQHMSNMVARLERKHAGMVMFSDMVGQCKLFTNALATAKIAADCHVPVWIDGEQGTGREMLARAIHGDGERAGKPFITVDCEQLQGDIADKLREAGQGTLYLREITRLPASMQQRVLDSHGVRIICSNGKDAVAMLRQGSFSPELHDKLRKIMIALPSLRDRKQDIAPLAEHFLSLHASLENKFPALLSEDAARLLEEHPWPGNICQLSNLIARSVLLCRQDHLDAATLRLIQQLVPVNYNQNRQFPFEMPNFFDKKGQIKKLRSIEEDAIRLALKHSGGCMTKAARNLGIGRSTLYRKIDEIEAGSYMLRENQTTRPMMPASAGEVS